MGRRRIDLAGQKFDSLTVIEFSHIDKLGYACWVCKCDCGKELVVRGHNLKSGNITGCACLQKKAPKEHIKKEVKKRKSVDQFLMMSF